MMCPSTMKSAKVVASKSGGGRYSSVVRTVGAIGLDPLGGVGYCGRVFIGRASFEGIGIGAW